MSTPLTKFEKTFLWVFIVAILINIVLFVGPFPDPYGVLFLFSVSLSLIINSILAAFVFATFILKRDLRKGRKHIFVFSLSILVMLLFIGSFFIFSSLGIDINPIKIVMIVITGPFNLR